MSAHHVPQILQAAGLSIRLGDNNTLKVTPTARLTIEIRALIKDHKPLLLMALHQANDETRVTCTNCRHLRQAKHCGNHRSGGAGEMGAEPKAEASVDVREQPRSVQGQRDEGGKWAATRKDTGTAGERAEVAEEKAPTTEAERAGSGKGQQQAPTRQEKR